MAKVCKNFDDVAEIVPNQGSTRIKVRVLRLWKIPSFLNPSEISSIEMVLIDEKIMFQAIWRIRDCNFFNLLSAGDALPDFLVCIFASFLLTVSIGKQWKEFLDYNETIGFIFHDDAKKLDRAAKNKYVV
ncbi:eukaryotic translation initiation factor 4E-1 [Trifolium repens]|nr:eukaryotic translation initiation factor 4E-1 [Trifolium repens]